MCITTTYTQPARRTSQRGFKLDIVPLMIGEGVAHPLPADETEAASFCWPALDGQQQPRRRFKGTSGPLLSVPRILDRLKSGRGSRVRMGQQK